jgi:hypothetical protein
MFKASLKAKTAKGLSWNDLCALCFLLSHLFVFILPLSAEDNEKERFPSPKIKE